MLWPVARGTAPVHHAVRHQWAAPATRLPALPDCRCAFGEVAVFEAGLDADAREAQYVGRGRDRAWYGGRTLSSAGNWSSHASRSWFGICFAASIAVRAFFSRSSRDPSGEGEWMYDQRTRSTHSH